MDNDLNNYQVEEVSYKRILVCVDDDDFISSKKAFDYACTIAKQFDVPLAIVSILEIGDLNIFQSLSPDVLDDRRNDIKNDLNIYVEKAQEYGVKNVKAIVGEGSSPARVIVEQVIPKYEPDLVVVGSETEKQGARKNLGSQAEHIVRFSKVSVTVVR